MAFPFELEYPSKIRIISNVLVVYRRVSTLNHRAQTLCMQSINKDHLIWNKDILVFLNVRTRRVPLMEQELCNLPEHLSFMCMFCRSLFVLSYIYFGHWHCVVCCVSIIYYTDSDYPFDIFKLFYLTQRKQVFIYIIIYKVIFVYGDITGFPLFNHEALLRRLNTFCR